MEDKERINTKDLFFANGAKRGLCRASGEFLEFCPISLELTSDRSELFSCLEEIPIYGSRVFE